jgi:hypothetical protein
MSKKKPQPDQSVTYEVITQEDKETGDLILPIPQELLDTLGWKPGDNIDFALDDKGRWIMKKL